MSEYKSLDGELNARIVYWGIPGAGTSTNLRGIHGKLRADRRGDLRSVPTPIDPTVSYEILPIELGMVGDLKTRIQIIAVPGDADQAPTRMQLLDRVDGVVLVLDSRRECQDANLASLAELRERLVDYGHDLSTLPMVVQLNKADLSDDDARQALRSRLDLGDVEILEASASAAEGVLQTLTTISKQVVRALRAAAARPEAPAPAPPPTPKSEIPNPPALEPSPASVMEEAILQIDAAPFSAVDAVLEAETALDQSWPQLSEADKRSGGFSIGSDLRIISVGTATRSGQRGVRIPVVLGNSEGESVTLALTVQLDPLLDEESG